MGVCTGGHGLREQLVKWLRSESSPFADATVQVRIDEEAFCSPKKVHAVILASSCQCLRGLWAGSFKEAWQAMEIDLKNESDGSAVEILIKVVYGGKAIVRTMDEHVLLYCLADKWQCECVLSAASAKIVSLV